MGRMEPVAGCQAVDSAGQGIDDTIDRQGFKDDAGGKRQDLLGADIQQVGQFSAASLSVVQTQFACAGVGVACFDDQRTDVVALCQVRFANLYRCCAEAVAGEDARNSGVVGHAEHGQIVVIGLAHACGGNADVDPGHGKDVTFGRNVKVYGHGAVSLESLDQK